MPHIRQHPRPRLLNAFAFLLALLAASPAARADQEAWASVDGRIPVQEAHGWLPTHARFLTDFRVAERHDGLSAAFLRLGAILDVHPLLWVAVQGTTLAAATGPDILTPEYRLEIEPNLRQRGLVRSRPVGLRPEPAAGGGGDPARWSVTPGPVVHAPLAPDSHGMGARPHRQPGLGAGPRLADASSLSATTRPASTNGAMDAAEWFHTASSARVKSSSRSRKSSTPIETRTMSSVMPVAASSSGLISEWVVVAG